MSHDVDFDHTAAMLTIRRLAEQMSHTAKHLISAVDEVMVAQERERNRIERGIDEDRRSG